MTSPPRQGQRERERERSVDKTSWESADCQLPPTLASGHQGGPGAIWGVLSVCGHSSKPSLHVLRQEGMGVTATQSPEAHNFGKPGGRGAQDPAPREHVKGRRNYSGARAYTQGREDANTASQPQEHARGPGRRTDPKVESQRPAGRGAPASHPTSPRAHSPLPNVGTRTLSTPGSS